MYVIATTDDTEPAPYIGSRKTTLDILARLEWKTETPTQDGWYWCDIGVVRVALEAYPNGNKELVVYTAESGRGNEEPESVDFYCKIGFHWLGPLPIPESPKPKKG